MTETTTAIFCRGCGYDLRASAKAQRCPECGRPFDPADARTYAARPPRRFWWRWTRRALLVVVTLALVTAAPWGWLYLGWRQEQSLVKRLDGFVNGCQTLDGTYISLGRPRWRSALGKNGFVFDRVQWLAIKRGDADLSLVPNLPRIRTLDLFDFSPTNPGLPELRRLAHLETLCFYGGQLTEPQLRDVAELRSLRSLRLGGEFRDSDLLHLRRLPNLVFLDLSNSPASNATIPYLKDLTGLEYLVLRGTRITPAGIAELRAALPKCEINGP